MVRAAGLDLAAAGVAIAASPRHASVMLIVGDLPQGLAEAATIVYAQMPRPRAILALGAELLSPLPPADVVAAADQAGLVEGVARLRTRIAAGAWSLDVEPFTASVLEGALADSAGGMDHSMMGHGHNMHDGGMDHGAMGHGTMDHGSMNHGAMDHSQMDHGSMDHAAMGHGAMDHDAPASGEQEPEPHGGTDHTEHGDHTHMACSGHTNEHHGAATGAGAADPQAAYKDMPENAGDALAAHDAPAAHDHHAHMHHEGSPAAQDETEPGHPGHALPMPDDQAQVTDHATRHSSAPSVASEHDPMDVGAVHQHHHDHAGMGPGDPESPDEPGEADRAALDHAAMGHAGNEGEDHGPMDHGTPERAMTDGSAGADTAPDEHAHMHHAEMDHSAMDHSMMGHDHHMMEGGFMSMVAMTQGLPRSTDGLPMEWIDTSFGPLFPGLPAGLAPTLTLDGDTVVGLSLGAGAVHRGIVATLPGPAGSFADRLAMLDPLAPIAYRALAQEALAAISGEPPDTAASAWAGACERERAASHMGWLAAFAELLGIGWLASRAAELHLALVHAADVATVAALRGRIARMVHDVDRLPMLERRLAGIGILAPDAPGMSGPIARGSGLAVDTRMRSSAYQTLGFEAVVREGGDALSRLQVRLAEIVQSLDLIIASEMLAQPATPLPSPHLSGTGMATVETPRGAAMLHVVVQHGQVTVAHVMPPSATHKALLTAATDQAELADALVAIASLDLSPWEIDQ